MLLGCLEEEEEESARERCLWRGCCWGGEEGGSGATGSELKRTDLAMGGGWDVALRSNLGRDGGDGDLARGVFTPEEEE